MTIHSIDLNRKKIQQLSGQWNLDFFLEWLFINIIHILEIRPVAENAEFDFFFKKWNYSLFLSYPVIIIDYK